VLRSGSDGIAVIRVTLVSSVASELSESKGSETSAMDKVAFHNLSDLELLQVNALSAAEQKAFRGMSLFPATSALVVWGYEAGRKDNLDGWPAIFHDVFATGVPFIER
jgi:hypothetical protein